MSYFRYIDNGKGPTKLFVGGIHGNEGKTSIKFIKHLKKDDFSCGQIYIYNFNKSPYISTLKEEFFSSSIGLKIISLVKELKPDFYTELHCYDLAHFDRLTSSNRFFTQGVPPLIDCGNHILISSVSPLIRMKYFTAKTVCKTLEFPCFNKLNSEIIKEFQFNEKLSIERYEDILKLIVTATSRINFEDKISSIYPKQAELAIYYAKKIFGKNFPPY